MVINVPVKQPEAEGGVDRFAVQGVRLGIRVGRYEDIAEGTATLLVF